MVNASEEREGKGRGVLVFFVFFFSFFPVAFLGFGQELN